MICFGCRIERYFKDCCSDYFYTNTVDTLSVYNKRTNVCMFFDSKIHIFPTNKYTDPMNYIIDVKCDKNNINECFEYFKKIEKLQVFS